MGTDRQRTLDQALQFHQAGEFASAEKIYHRLLQTEPESFAPLHMLGVLRAQQNRPGEAIQWIERALKVEPGAAMAWFNHANVLAGSGRAGDALESYDKA